MAKVIPTIAIDRDQIKELLLTTSGHVLLFGPPGTGKSSLAEWYAHKRGQDGTWAVNFTTDMSAGLIVGHPSIIDTGAGYWVKGPAIQAWERGEVLLLDDLHEASADGAAELLTILNDPAWVHKVLPDGSIIRPKDRGETKFRAIGTMNGVSTDLPPALLDRFTENIILVRKPSTEMMLRLDPDVRDVIDQAYEVCDALNGELPRFSYREARAFCRRRADLMRNAATNPDTKLPKDKEEIQRWAAELALGGDPKRADGFLRTVVLAQAEDPDAEPSAEEAAKRAHAENIASVESYASEEEFRAGEAMREALRKMGLRPEEVSARMWDRMKAEWDAALGHA